MASKSSKQESQRNLLTKPYVPSSNVKKAPNFNKQPQDIRLNRNNLLANLAYPQNLPLFEPMARFLECHHIGDALNANPGKMYHDYLCELWYTARVDDVKVIHCSVKDGQCVLSFGLDLFRKAIGLDYIEDGESYEEIPKNTCLRSVLEYANYKDLPRSEDGKILNTGMIQKKNLSDTWKMFFSHIIESLGGSSGGHDQVNAMQMEIAYALVKGIRIDFAKLIFENLITKLSGKTRTPFIPYIRFLSLVLRELMGSNYEDDSLEYDVPTVIHDIYLNASPDESEVPLSPEMVRFLPPSLSQKYKTLAALPAGKESASSEPQKNEGLKESTGGDQSLEAPSVTTQPPTIILNPTPLQTFPKESGVVPKGPPRKTRSKSLRPKDTRNPASPSSASKKADDELKGKQQTTGPTPSVGGTGKEKEHGSTQPIIESVSAPSTESQDTSRTLSESALAHDTSEFTSEVEATQSGPHDPLVTQQTESEGPKSTNISSDEAEEAAELIQERVLRKLAFSHISSEQLEQNISRWEEDDVILEISSSSEEVDEELVVDGQSTSPVLEPKQTPTPPPIPPFSNIPPQTTYFSPMDTEDIRDIQSEIPIPSVPTQTETPINPTEIIQPIIFQTKQTQEIPTPSPDSPPNTLETRIEANTSEIHNLALKVLDCKNSILDHNLNFQALKGSVSKNVHGIQSELKIFESNQNAVASKLNDLIERQNHFTKSLKDTSSNVETGVKMAITSNLASFRSIIERQWDARMNLISELVKPAHTTDQLIAGITTEVKKIVTSEIAKLVPSEIGETLQSIKSDLSHLKDTQASVSNLLSEVSKKMIC